MRAVAAGCLALGLVLTACSAGPATEADDPRASASTASSSPTATASETPSATASASPSTGPAAAPPASPEPPPATDDRRGRTAFARYVLQAWIHSLNTNDPGALLSVSGREPCEGCEQLVRELRDRRRQGWSVALAGVRVSGVTVTARGRTARAVLTISIPESTSVNADGSFRSTNPAHPRSTFTVEMVRERARYRLTSFSLS